MLEEMSFLCLGVLPLYLKAVEDSMEAALQEDAWSKSDVVIAMLLLTPPLGGYRGKARNE